ncbi:MAG: hypothetical protein AUH85_00625 [Chloroflexi bacterium 13_1_40CM_4_68_4]|nr:MAG: hypothetical protein AUH85_00625 [Chloroflexi bacterium 13_1_40CM_4_68_4]
MNRRLVLLASALAAIAVLSRLPFVTHILWQWDSVLYARALEQGFHVDYLPSLQRPHPPGYIFYVALAALFDLVLQDSNAALVAVSILGTALAVVAIFLFARRFSGLGPATIAAAGYAFSPLVWLYGEVAYPYALLGFLAVALAATFYEARRRTPRWRLAASLLFGLAAGFRQDVLVLFSPLWVWMMWRGDWRERITAALAVAVACLAWFVPSALLSGGVERYLTAVVQQSTGVGIAYSVPGNGFQALSYNLRFTLYGLAWGLFAFAILLAGLALAPVLWWARHGQWRLRLHADNAFFILWIASPLAFYIAIHIGEWGYLLTILPGLYVLIAALLPRLVRPLRGMARGSWRVLAAGLVASGALVFLYVPDARFSADAVHDHDVAIAAKVDYIRTNFAPDATIVLAREDYLQVRYYLSEYSAWLYDPDPYVAATVKRHKKMPQKATTVVLFSKGLQPMQPQDLQYALVAPDVTLAYFVVEPGTVLEFAGTRFGVREASAR